MGHDRPTVTVFAPHLTLAVTIEAGRQDEPEEVHVHPGGQGFWVARMLRHLGERPIICGPVGGEPGAVIRGLFGQWGLDFSPVPMQSSSPVTVQDRRGGDREVVAQTVVPRLTRHEADDMYGRFLDHAISSTTCVMTGQPDQVVPTSTYRRLAHDLAAGSVTVVGDLHGPELEATLEGGPLDILKVSDEDLASDGWLDDPDDLRHVLDRLVAAGARSVVVSRQHRPAVARIGGRYLEARTPALEPPDFRGAGDSMTAGLAAGLIRSLGPEETLRLACAAGAANVTRHGLGSASEDLIPVLAERVEIKSLAATR